MSEDLLDELQIFNAFGNYVRLLDLLKLMAAMRKDRPDLWEQVAEYSRSKRKESNAEMQKTRT